MFLCEWKFIYVSVYFDSLLAMISKKSGGMPLPSKNQSSRTVQ